MSKTYALAVVVEDDEADVTEVVVFQEDIDVLLKRWNEGSEGRPEELAALLTEIDMAVTVMDGVTE